MTNDTHIIGMRPENLDAARSVATLWKLPTDGEPIPFGHALPDLSTLQDFVGGYIEHVSLVIGGEPVALFVVDEPFPGLPVNEHATRLVVAAVGGELPPDRFYVPREYAVRGPAWAWIGELPND